jgi:hypothetical protein
MVTPVGIRVKLNLCSVLHNYFHLRLSASEIYI